MTYQVQNSDNSKTFIISDNVVDDGSLSLSLIGRNVSNYGQYVARNTIHQLENFASAIAPNNPLTGQLWYDKTPGSEALKVWDSATWVSTGGGVSSVSIATGTGLTGGPLAATGSTVGIATSVRPSATQSFGASSGMYSTFGATTIDFLSSGNSVLFRMTAAGVLHADGDIVAFSTTISDQRLKSDIQVVSDALEKLRSLRGVEYTYTHNGRRSAGLIAQEVEQIMPQAVTETELPLQVADGEKYKVLQYDQLFSVLVEAIKELADRVEKLENK